MKLSAVQLQSEMTLKVFNFAWKQKNAGDQFLKMLFGLANESI